MPSEWLGGERFLETLNKYTHLIKEWTRSRISRHHREHAGVGPGQLWSVSSLLSFLALLIGINSSWVLAQVQNCRHDKATAVQRGADWERESWLGECFVQVVGFISGECVLRPVCAQEMTHLEEYLRTARKNWISQEPSPPACSESLFSSLWTDWPVHVPSTHQQWMCNVLSEQHDVERKSGSLCWLHVGADASDPGAPSPVSWGALLPLL